MATVTTNVSGIQFLRYVLTNASDTINFTNGFDGQRLTVTFQQDATGGRAIAGGNVSGFPQPDHEANADTTMLFIYDSQTNVWNYIPESSGAATAFTASGAIPVQSGLVTLGGGSAQAYTLAAPTAAQDGTTMTFSVVTAHAHTLTTPANKINGGADTVTFAAVGDSITLRASNTVWYVVGASGTATLSEV
jgi:hypothetical protein